jgi:hypothetical protein
VLGGVDVSSCSSCTNGYGLINDSNCVSCSSGTFGVNQTCYPCSIGKFTDTLGSTSCKDCPIGRYASSNQSAGCTQCPNGFTTSQNGSTSASDCISCQPGEYTIVNSDGSVQCKVNETAAALTCSSKFQVVAESSFPYAYGFVNTNISTWSKGDDLCSSTLNPYARMASIRDRLVQNYIADQQRWYWVAASQVSQLVEPAGGWFWNDGLPANGTLDNPRYFLWSQGFPNDTNGRNCALFTFEPGMKDALCTFAYNVACEIHCMTSFEITFL